MNREETMQRICSLFEKAKKEHPDWKFTAALLDAKSSSVEGSLHEITTVQGDLDLDETTWVFIMMMTPLLVKGGFEPDEIRKVFADIAEAQIANVEAAREVQREIRKDESRRARLRVIK